MNSTILKSLLLAFVVWFNVYAFNTNIPTKPLLMMHLALAIAILTVIFLLKNNMVNLLLLWFLLVLFQRSLGAIAIPMLPDIAPERIIMILIVVIFIVEMTMQQRRVLSFSAAEIAMMIFSVYVIFSMIISGTIVDKKHGLTLGLYLGAYGIPFFIFFISKNIIDDETKIKKFFFLLAVIGLYLGITAMLGYFQVFPRYFGAGEARAGGPFDQPGVNGTVMGMLLFAGIFLLLHENKRWKKYLYVISLICLPVGILFALTRSAWFASLVAIFTVPILIPRSRKPFFVSLLIVSFLSLLFIFANLHETKTRKFANEVEFVTKKATLMERIVNRTTATASVTGRQGLYKTAFNMFFDKPFFGHGYGAFLQSKKEFGIDDQLLYGKENRFEARQAGLHDTIIALLLDLGITGLSLYLFILIYIVNCSIKLYIKLPRETFLGKDLIAACIGMFIVSLICSEFFDMRFFIFHNSLFFCIAGITVGLYQRMLRNEAIGNTA